MSPQVITGLFTLGGALDGAVVGWFGAYLNNRQALKHQEEVARLQATEARLAQLFPLQREALEAAWKVSMEIVMGREPKQGDMERMLGPSLWLPEELQEIWSDAMNKASDREAMLTAARAINEYVRFFRKQHERNLVWTGLTRPGDDQIPK